eukprot:gene4956-5083_t
MLPELNLCIEQTIPSSGLFDAELFNIGSQTVLATARFRNGGGKFDVDSHLYRHASRFAHSPAHTPGTPLPSFDSHLQAFDPTPFQSIPTTASVDFDFHLAPDGAHLMAVANYRQDGDPRTYLAGSQVYRWDPSSASFTLVQTLPTRGARDM